jgi:hypothetical protein
VLLAASCPAGAERARALEERSNETTLLMAVDCSQGPEAASAHIVACYRWLLAQLVPSCDVHLLATEDLTGALHEVVRRLRSSGDEMPAFVGIGA